MRYVKKGWIACNTRPCPSLWPPPPTRELHAEPRATFVRATWCPNERLTPASRLGVDLVFTEKRSAAPRSWLRQLSRGKGTSMPGRGGALRHVGVAMFFERKGEE